jgi:hypothetical protein
MARPDYTGMDVIIVRGDKIAALYVFLDSMPSCPTSRLAMFVNVATVRSLALAA